MCYFVYSISLINVIIEVTLLCFVIWREIGINYLWGFCFISFLYVL